MIPLLVALLTLAAFPRDARAASQPLRAAVHVHTTLSTGALTLEEVLEEARRERLDALLLADNFLVRFEYGLFPLRGLVRKVVEKPSVIRTGVDRYLQAVEAAQARFPDLVLVPGVEVIPYYYWTGSPWTGDLTQWDAQKNLLVFGLTRPAEYAGIPAVGAGGARVPGPARLAELVLAAVALVGGTVLLRLRRERPVRLRRFTLRTVRRYRLPGAMTLGLGAALALDAVMVPEFHPYQGRLGIEPYQRVVDYAESLGGAVVWSYPEARDFGRFDVGPGRVTVRTDPAPEVLLQSRGYTGFGAVYEDTVTFTEPGRHWDQLLREYAEGRRARPAWAIGELGYHGRDKRLGGVTTVFLAAERSRAGLLAALRAGRLYAVRSLGDYHLVLEEFAMAEDGGPDWVTMGGEVAARGAAPLRLRVRIAASDGRAVRVAGRVVRSGVIVAALEGTTPLERTLTVDPPAPGRREFVRLEVREPARLLANPIFVRRQG